MEVTTMEWETPEFEEIGTSAEVTAAWAALVPSPSIERSRRAVT